MCSVWEWSTVPLRHLRSREHIVLTKLLVELRKSRFKNQKDFVSEIGWGRNKVERIEAGSKIPSALEVREWATACGITPYALTWRLEARLKEKK